MDNNMHITNSHLAYLLAACNLTSARRGWAVLDGRRMWTDGVAHRLEDGSVACWYEDAPYETDGDKCNDTKGQEQ